VIDSHRAEQVSPRTTPLGHMVVTWAWDARKYALTLRRLPA